MGKRVGTAFFMKPPQRTICDTKLMSDTWQAKALKGYESLKLCMHPSQASLQASIRYLKAHWGHCALYDASSCNPPPKACLPTQKLYLCCPHVTMALLYTIKGRTRKGHTTGVALWSHQLVGNWSVCKLDHQHLAAHLLAIVAHDGLLSQKLVCICNEATPSAQTIWASQDIQLQDLTDRWEDSPQVCLCCLQMHRYSWWYAILTADCKVCYEYRCKLQAQHQSHWTLTTASCMREINRRHHVQDMQCA